MEQIDLSNSLLWIFGIAVALLVFFVILRIVTNKERLFTYYGEDIKACKRCGQSYIKWKFHKHRIISSIWIIAEHKEPIDKFCKCQKLINPEEHENS